MFATVPLPSKHRYIGSILWARSGYPGLLQRSYDCQDCHLPDIGKLEPADYLPSIDAAARFNLVICDGGNPTAQQALTADVPVLGITCNMDQFLNIAASSKPVPG